MLTESEVQRSWRKLFAQGNSSEETLKKAEQLLENVRPESPLRYRLMMELDEIRKMAKAQT